jgi:hypothetical protein
MIRWAFEKQGLYQPAGTVMPNSNEDAPPPVDVYIEDGRSGEYRSSRIIGAARRYGTGATMTAPRATRSRSSASPTTPM